MKRLSATASAEGKWLVGYENWPYDHIDVNIVGWAVIDKNCLLDLHDDEVVYTETEYYDSHMTLQMVMKQFPINFRLHPRAFKIDHFADQSYQYPWS